MAKIVVATITSLTNESSAITQINQNFAEIVQQLEAQLSRSGLNYDGTGVAANTMLTNVDMNSYRILNLPAPVAYTEPARHGEIQVYVDNAAAQATAAAGSATAAAGSATAASGSATSAASSATSALSTYNTFRTYWLGLYAGPPVIDLLGNPLIDGALYYDTALLAVRVLYSGVWRTWPEAINSISGLTDVTLAALANNDILRYSSGTTHWTNQQLTSTQDITAVLDGGGSVLAANTRIYIPIDFACTIQQVTMLGDISGSAVVDVWKCTYAQFDAGSTHPVAADKITAAAPPTITTATKAQDATLTGWTKSIAAGDVLAFNVTSATTITRLTVALKVTKTL